MNTTIYFEEDGLSTKQLAEIVKKLETTKAEFVSGKTGEPGYQHYFVRGRFKVGLGSVDTLINVLTVSENA